MFPSSPPLRQTLYPPPYDFTGYPHPHHHVSGVGDASSWSSVYAPREEYPFCFQGSSPGGAQVGFTPPDLSVAPTAAGGGGGSLPPYNILTGPDPFISRTRAHETLRQSLTGGKTRTKDKYRVVYTDRQRLELEKEFQYNRYITMRRKTEMSLSLGLSERQVKIWFQNRRAKERKVNRKKLQHPSQQQASTTTPTPPVLPGHGPPSPGSVLSDPLHQDY